MSTIFIPTTLGDIHAASVGLVLKEMGHRPIRWFCQDMPEAGSASFFIGRGPRRVTVREGWGSPVDVHDVDVLWHRRVGSPIVRNPDAHPSDRQVAVQETSRFQRGLLRTLSQRVFSVNDYAASVAAENKLVQLQAAREVGFEVPETLVSNDPEHIKAFLREHDTTGAIFKVFKPITWHAGHQVATVFTHRVDVDVLPLDPMLQLSPGIFQAYVPKAFELRVTCMGAEQFAARLDSQATQHGGLDWRLEPLESLPIAALDLPDRIARRCRALMERLGLVFGCFDLIVTPAGEYVFLELNQMGQFLWIEQLLPEFPLLQAFCEFLVSRDSNFRYAPSTRHRYPFAAIRDSARAVVAHDLATHVMPTESPKVVRE
jgi:glutathione synthase/RimK-type ligase-like ATP-grasp enzyme